jgi:putative DNA primase/helicase
MLPAISELPNKTLPAFALQRETNGDRITLLTATGRLLMAKRWRTDGTVEGYGNGKNFKHRTALVNDVRHLSTLLQDIEADAQTCVIRGGYIGEELALPLMQHTEHWTAGCVLRNQEVFKDRKLHMMLADIDGYESLFVDPVTQPVEAIEEFIHSCLPACFRGISYHWQLSNGAGHVSNAGKLKAHVWFWLETPYTSAELKAWVKANNFPIDVAVFHEIQAHYTAAPIFEAGQTNPVPVRSGFVEGLFGDSVPLVLDEQLLSAVSQSAGTVSRKETLRNAIARDDVAQRLYDRGMVRSERTDGGLNIVCPREDQHESKSGETASIYYPANTGGYAQGNFKCMHAHCLDVPRHVFTEALGFSAADGFQDIEGERKDVSFDVLLGQRLANMLGGRYLHEHGGRGWLKDTVGAWLERRRGAGGNADRRGPVALGC